MQKVSVRCTGGARDAAGAMTTESGERRAEEDLTTNMKIQFRIRGLKAVAAFFLAACLVQTGCRPSGSSETLGREPGSGGKTTIQVKGSDTMVNLAQVWAEEYHKVDPNVSIEVSGGGTGVGIAAPPPGRH